MQQDRKIVMAAVSHHGNRLAYVNPRFKRDKAIVMAAVANNVSALRFMHSSLKSDKDIALLALKYASARLKNDRKDSPKKSVIAC